MDFFEAQDRARRLTLRLVVLFAVAVAALISLTVLLFGALIAVQRHGALNLTTLQQALTVELTLGLALAVSAVVALASLFRHLSLRGGGRTVAEQLGAKRLPPNSAEPEVQRLQNVVEEMAIAAGTPVPPIYLLEEQGINAFAAGYSPDDAVLGVTRGALEQLSRDELQGVIGHEFSHILNGDMRLNTHLLALLFGILAIGLIGRQLIFSGSLGRRRIHGGSRRRGSGGQVVLVGVGLMVLGYLGTFCGKAIKAAVSRQREFLADASAVQFTRNPSGIAGALRRIGGLPAHSSLQSGSAEEISHMFFGPVSGLGASGMSGLLATHPPLRERIRALDPQWDGHFTDQGPATPKAAAEATGASATAVTANPSGAAAALAMHQVGQVTPQDVANAQQLLGQLPRELYQACHDPYGARAVVYSLLLDREPAVAERQHQQIVEQAEAGVPELVAGLEPVRHELQAHQKLPLVQLCLPALKSLSPGQYRRFCAVMLALIRADARIAAFEWSLHRVLLKELKPEFEPAATGSAGRQSLESLAPAVATVLSTLARTAHANPRDAAAAVNQAGRQLSLTLDFEAEPDPELTRLSRAVTQLQALAPLARPRLLKGSITAAATAEGELSADADALLHGLGAALDCPLPPRPAPQT